MSNTIRSISQNNYLLATQQEVSHDNKLTGNGTPESPLSVVAEALYTAGITDVEYVNELPASPTSGVLYLIPES